MYMLLLEVKYALKNLLKDACLRFRAFIAARGGEKY